MFEIVKLLFSLSWPPQQVPRAPSACNRYTILIKYNKNYIILYRCITKSTNKSYRIYKNKEKRTRTILGRYYIVCVFFFFFVKND